MENREIIAIVLITCIIFVLISIIHTRLYLNKEVVDEIYLLTTSIISSYNDDSGAGPKKRITKFFLAKEEKGKYYELFSNVLIKEKESKGGYLLDIPYIEKVEPLKDYLKNQKEKIIKKEVLFEFLVLLNTDETVKAIVSKEKDNDNEENL